MLKLLTLTEHFKERLVLILSEYLKDFTKENISELNLGVNSNLVLKDLEIREDLLLLNSLPLVINQGKISRIKITVSFVPILYKSSPMHIDVENVDIHVRLFVEQRNFEDMKQKIHNPLFRKKSIHTESYKDRKLRDWENKTRKHFRELAPPGWAKTIIDNILKNMVITVRNFTIYYESQSLLNIPSLIKINLQEFTVHSTDENWVHSFNSKTSKHFREILLKDLSITLNLNKKPESKLSRDKFEKEFLGRKSKPKFEKKTTTESLKDFLKQKFSTSKKYVVQEPEEDNIIDEEYQKLKEGGTYFLFPISTIVRIKRELDLSKDFSSEPQKAMFIEIKDPIIFMLNKDHIHYLGELSKHLRMMNTVIRNIHLRPIDSPRENPIAWWIYAIKATTEERKRATSLKKTISNLRKMRKYIELYKRKQTIIHVPWLPRLTQEESVLFKSLEDELPVQSLLQFREWAFIEIRIEAKRFLASNQGAQRMKPLIDIWSNAINNENTFTTSKHKIPESIQLTTVEQSDLYEILALDKTKVLESYLKGQNSDPKDIVLDLNIDFRSLYFLITEPKQDLCQVMVDTNRHKIASVKDWWIKDGGKSFIAHNPIIKSLNFLDGPTEMKTTAPTTEKVIKSETTLMGLKPHENDGEEMKEVPLESKVIQTDIANEQSESCKSESYLEHIKDVEREVPECFIEEDQESDIIKEETPECEKNKESKQSSDGRWNQNLILIGEISSITASIRKFKSGRITSEKLLEIKNIMISTALNLPKAINDRDFINRNRKTPIQYYLRYETLFDDILFFDFPAILKAEQGNMNPFIKFIRDNSCGNFASFLETYEKLNRDRRDINNPSYKTVSLYRSFFDPKDPLFIDFPSDIVTKFNQPGNPSASKETQMKMIWEAFNSLKIHISRTILPSFLFSYGVMVLPYILNICSESINEQEAAKSHLPQIKKTKNLLGKFKRFSTGIHEKIFPRSQLFKKHTIIALSDSILSFFFDIEGADCQFKIEKLDLDKKRKGPAHTLDIGLNDEKESESKFELTVPPITIHLSTEAFQPLVVFFKSFESAFKHKSSDIKEKFEDTSKVYVEDYQKLMDCIEYNQKIKPTETPPKNLKIKVLLHSLSIEVSNYRSHFIHERRLALNIKRLKFKQMPRAVKETSDSVLKDYQKTTLQVEKFEILESFYANEVYNDIHLIKTKFILNLYTCIYNNHPLYTDKKIHLLIPFFKLHVDDNLVLLSELLHLFKQSPKIEKQKEEAKVKNSPLIEMGENQIYIIETKLMNKLCYLLSDHKKGNQNCKHCILRYKKSSLIMNIFVGNLSQKLDGIVETAFNTLTPKDELSQKDYGLFITIKHSLTRTIDPPQTTLLHLPFFVFTQDAGFFKNNIAIHCTSSSPAYRYAEDSYVEDKLSNCVLSTFQPTVKANKNCLSLLDDHFWVYFMSLEELMSDTKNPEKNEDLEYMHSSTKNMPKTNENRRLDEDDNVEESVVQKEEDIYVLFIRKKFLRHNLLKVFDIYRKQRDFNNILALRISEIKIDFSTLASFSTIANTIDGIKQVNNWLSQLIKPQDSQGNMSTNTFNNDEKEESYSTGKTNPDTKVIAKRFRRENILVTLDKMSLVINLDKLDRTLSLEVDNFKLDTCPKKSICDMVHRQIFSIESIKIKTNKRGFCHISKVKVKYFETENELCFSIKQISHKNSKVALFNLPSKINPSNSLQKKAFTMHFIFKDDLLLNVNVIIAPVHLYLSDIEIEQEINPFIILNSFLSQERLKTSNVLREMAFDTNVLDQIQKDTQNTKRTERAFPKFNQQDSKIAHENLLVAILAERLTVQWAKSRIEFATLDVESIKYEIDLTKNYRAEIEKISLIPYDSYYENLFINQSKEMKNSIRVYKEDNYPVLHIYGYKIIYLGRVIKEIQNFFKDIKSKSGEIAKDLLESSRNYYQDFEEGNQHEKPPILLKVCLEDSCVVVPRNSMSKDIVLIAAKLIEIKIDKEVREIEIPPSVDGSQAVIPKKNFIKLSDVPYTQRSLASVFHISAANGEVFCVRNSVGKRIGQAAHIQMTMVLPDPNLFTDIITFHYLLEGQVFDFSMSLNLGLMTELDLITQENSKEPSKLFETPVSYAHSKISALGQNLLVKTSKTKIAGDLVRDLLQRREEMENTQEE